MPTTDPGLIEMMRDAGWSSWACLFLGLVFSGAGVAAIALSAARVSMGRTLAMITLAGALLTVVVGYAGQASGRRMVEQAVAAVNPADKALIRAEGYREASYAFSLGLDFALLPALLGAIATGLALRAAAAPRPAA